MRRLFLRSILELALFVITVSLASKFVGGIAYLLLEAGSPLLKDWIQAHSAWRNLFQGTLAGLAPARLCFTAFLWFAPKDNPDLPQFTRFLKELDVDAAQGWTWVFFSPLFLVIVLDWVESQNYLSSVFESRSHLSIGSFMEYWALELSYTDPRSGYPVDWNWMKQVFYIWILAASAGYSLAPWLRKVGVFVYKKMYGQPVAILDEAEKSRINVKIDPI